MKKTSIIALLMTVVLYLFVTGQVFSIEPGEEVAGNLRPVLLKVTDTVERFSRIFIGPVAVDITEEDIVYSELNIGTSLQLLKQRLSQWVMFYGTEFLKRHSGLNLRDVRGQVLPALKAMNLNTYDAIDEDTAQALMSRVAAHYMVLGKIVNRGGKWIILLHDGRGNTWGETEFDEEVMLRLVKWLIDQPEPESEPEAEKSEPDSEPEPNAIASSSSVPPEQDRYNRYFFRDRNTRSVQFTRALNESGMVIVVYQPLYGQNAEIRPAFVILDLNAREILNVSTSTRHRDRINGVQRSQDGKTFWTYGEDGLVVCYSTSTFQELYYIETRAPVKSLGLTKEGFLVTNFGDSSGKVYDQQTQRELRRRISNSSILNFGSKDDPDFRYRDGIVILSKNNQEILKTALYEDGIAGIIYNDDKEYKGDQIERHIDVLEHNRRTPRRPLENSDRSGNLTA